MKRGSPAASVIVPAHAKPHRLRLTLAGLVGQKGDGDFELLVVADGAVEEVYTVLADYQTRYGIRVIDSPGRGRAAARNLGAASACGRCFIFVDDDILCKGDFVIQHINAQKSKPGIVKGKLREIIGLTQVEDPALGGTGCRPVSEEALLNGVWTHEGVRYVCNALEQAAENQIGFNAPWLASAGANISVDAAVWARCGGFDESYGLSWGLEDIDFGYRAYKAGININFCEQALGLHMSHPQIDRWRQQESNWNRFLQNAECAEAQALPALLAADGSPAKFAAAVHQIRQYAVSPC